MQLDSLFIEPLDLFTERMEELPTLGVMVKISRVRSTARRRSRSVIGMESVCVDVRLNDVLLDSREERSLAIINGVQHTEWLTHPADTLP